MSHWTYFYDGTVSLTYNISLNHDPQQLYHSSYHHRFYCSLPLIVAHVMVSTICLPVVRTYGVWWHHKFYFTIVTVMIWTILPYSSNLHGSTIMFASHYCHLWLSLIFAPECLLSMMAMRFLPHGISCLKWCHKICLTYITFLMAWKPLLF